MIDGISGWIMIFFRIAFVVTEALTCCFGSDLGLEEDDTLQLACRLHALPGLLGLYVASATPGLHPKLHNVRSNNLRPHVLFCRPRATSAR